MKISSGSHFNYPKDPSSAKRVIVIKCHVDKERRRRSEPLDPEQARRILTEDMPKKIERLRREFRELYFGERGRARREEEQEAA